MPALKHIKVVNSMQAGLINRFPEGCWSVVPRASIPSRPKGRDEWQRLNP
jgi:hypothetical protein